MAKVKITGHASGTGVITVTAPNTSTDRTITLPDATATIATTTDVAARLPSITDGGNATAITITSAERIGINHTTPEARLEIDGGSETGLLVRSTVAGEYPAIFQSASTGTVPILSLRNNSGVGPLEVLSDGRGLSQFTAKAWVNWDGTNTPGLKDSHNVSSVTDNGTGNFTIALSNNMSNTNYSVTSMSTRSGGAADDVMVNGINGNLRTNGADFHVVRIKGDGAGANSYWDVNTNCAHFFGD